MTPAEVTIMYDKYCKDLRSYLRIAKGCLATSLNIYRVIEDTEEFWVTMDSAQNARIRELGELASEVVDLAESVKRHIL